MFGQALTSLYRFDEAIKAFNKCFKILPKSEWYIIYHYISDIYVSVEDKDQAENLLKKMLEDNSGSAAAYLFFGAFYGKRGKFEKSEYYLKVATAATEGAID